LLRQYEWIRCRQRSDDLAALCFPSEALLLGLVLRGQPGFTDPVQGLGLGWPAPLVAKLLPAVLLGLSLSRPAAAKLLELIPTRRSVVAARVIGRTGLFECLEFALGKFELILGGLVVGLAEYPGLLSHAPQPKIHDAVHPTAGVGGRLGGGGRDLTRRDGGFARFEVSQPGSAFGLGIGLEIFQ
jgi:hypothetical protein